MSHLNFLVQNRKGRFLTGWNGLLPIFGRKRHAIKIQNVNAACFDHPLFEGAKFTNVEEKVEVLVS